MAIRAPGLILAAAALAAATPARADRLDLITTCHAKGDGQADDGLALKNCLVHAQAAAASGRPAVLHIPAGIFRIGAQAGGMPIMTRAVTVAGEGPHASTLLLDEAFAGDLFAWDEAWVDGSAGPDQIILRRDTAGPTVTGLRITGNRAARPRQNALVFYDRNDHVLVRDIEVDYLNGTCLAMGQTLHVPVAYMRESTFMNLKCFSTGPSGGAAISLSSTARPGSDASNELDFYKLAVFDAPGTGVAIRNRHLSSATRGIRFFGLRVESTGGDGVAVGDNADLGQVAGITIFDLTVIGAKGAALRIAGGTAGAQPYGIRVSGGSIGPGNHTGIQIDNGRMIDLDLDNIDSPLVLGPIVGTDITIRGNGSQHLWQVGGTDAPGRVAQPLELRSPFSLRGLPASGDRVGVASLRADMAGGMSKRLTMDGKTPDAYNCFNPSYGQTFLMDIKLLAQDLTAPARSFAWTMPSGILSAWYGPGTARFIAGPVTVSGTAVQGAVVSAAADTANGCLALALTPPLPASHHWAATALVTFVRAP